MTPSDCSRTGRSTALRSLPAPGSEPCHETWTRPATTPAHWPQLSRSWLSLRQLAEVLGAYHADTADTADTAALSGGTGHGGQHRTRARARARVRQAAAEAAENGGRWIPTPDELAWAARRAWRDEPRCIGRWRSALTVRDRRHLTDPAQIAADLVAHLRDATGDGRVRSVVTILHPDVVITNEQLIGYAGYRQPDGTLLGDPRHHAITDQALAAGWPGGHPTGQQTPRRTRTAWDVLPLLITRPTPAELTQSDPTPTGPAPTSPTRTGTSVYELPPESVHTIRLHHPAHPWLAELGLRWYAVPALASHALHLTDTVAYPVVFSGHYLSTEIACRDLADPDRYNALPAIAAGLGLNTGTPRSLWPGHAEQILHEAVLASFDAAGVRIADPITEAEHYHRWTLRERQAGRTVREDWSWIVPPHAPARTAVYHRYLPTPVPCLPAYRPRPEPSTP